VQNFSGLMMKLKPKQRVSLNLAIVFWLTAVICHAQSGWIAKRVSSGGKDLNAVYFADAKRGWVGGDGGFFSYTEDGGANWAERPLGIDHAINDIHFVSKETGFVLAGGSIFETADGGHSWREAHKFLPSEFDGAMPELYSLRFNGKKRGWVVGSASRGDVITNSILASTRDGGATWQVLQAPTRQELIHIDFVDEKRGWIVGAAGAILHTDDAGRCFMLISAATREVGQLASAGRSCGPRMADGHGLKSFHRRARLCSECNSLATMTVGSSGVAAQFYDRATGAAPGSSKRVILNKICSRCL